MNDIELALTVIAGIAVFGASMACYAVFALYFVTKKMKEAKINEISRPELRDPDAHQV